MGISGYLLDWFGCLNFKTQRVALEGSFSHYKILNARVPQGSLLSPLLFLVYINDIVEEIGSNIRLFADDTSLLIGRKKEAVELKLAYGGNENLLFLFYKMF